MFSGGCLFKSRLGCFYGIFMPLVKTGWTGTWGRLSVFQSDHELEISVFQKLKLPALFNIQFDPL
jgi:hypothetical protein